MLSGGGELRKSYLVRLVFKFFFFLRYSTRRAVLSKFEGSFRGFYGSIYWLVWDDSMRRLLPRLESPKGDTTPDTDPYLYDASCKFEILCLTKSTWNDVLDLLCDFWLLFSYYPAGVKVLFAMSGIGVGVSLKIFIAVLICSRAFSTKPYLAVMIPSMWSSPSVKPARLPNFCSTFLLRSCQFALFFLIWLVDS